jgi:hypothetical protein
MVIRDFDYLLNFVRKSSSFYVSICPVTDIGNVTLIIFVKKVAWDSKTDDFDPVDKSCAR